MRRRFSWPVAPLVVALLLLGIVASASASLQFDTTWGSSGSGDGEFADTNYTVASITVATDSSGNVYVADYGNDRVQKFSSSGSFLTKWGTSGSGDGQFSGPAAIATDSSNNVYVSDSGNDRVQKFSSSGSFLTKWGTS